VHDTTCSRELTAVGVALNASSTPDRDRHRAGGTADGWLASVSGRGASKRAKARGAKGGVLGSGVEVPRGGLRLGWYAHDGSPDNRTGNRKKPRAAPEAEE
jgi:hypothetical protein